MTVCVLVFNIYQSISQNAGILKDKSMDYELIKLLDLWLQSGSLSRIIVIEGKVMTLLVCPNHSRYNNITQCF